MTNVSYRRFKQKDFNNASFIIDIFLFIVQYFTPINLDKKLNNEKGKFVSSIYKEVIRPVLNLFFFFFYNKISQALKSTKSTIITLVFFKIRFCQL